jgi:hypothetical protein
MVGVLAAETRPVRQSSILEMRLPPIVHSRDRQAHRNPHHL